MVIVSAIVAIVRQIVLQWQLNLADASWVRAAVSHWSNYALTAQWASLETRTEAAYVQQALAGD